MILHRTSGALWVWAPAKLNLFLEVLAKRADGYHEIETLMVTVNLYDTLSLREGTSSGVAFRCTAAERFGLFGHSPQSQLPRGRENLVVQAAELLREYTGVRQGVEILLQKRIPLAAGLAGGSSDAAAALVGLNRFWNLGLRQEQLCELAARLGSDVAFFLCGAAAVCRGRGERVEPVALPQAMHLVIACPRQGISTAAVYANCRPAEVATPIGPLVDAVRRGRLNLVAQRLLNRLFPSAASLCAEMLRLRSVFSQLGFLGHQMSGSGSAYFGLCRSRREARSLAARLSAQGYQAFTVRTSP